MVDIASGRLQSQLMSAILRVPAAAGITRMETMRTRAASLFVAVPATEAPGPAKPAPAPAPIPTPTDPRSRKAPGRA